MGVLEPSHYFPSALKPLYILLQILKFAGVFSSKVRLFLVLSFGGTRVKKPFFIWKLRSSLNLLEIFPFVPRWNHLRIHSITPLEYVMCSSMSKKPTTEKSLWKGSQKRLFRPKDCESVFDLKLLNSARTCN